MSTLGTAPAAARGSPGAAGPEGLTMFGAGGIAAETAACGIPATPGCAGAATSKACCCCCCCCCCCACCCAICSGLRGTTGPPPGQTASRTQRAHSFTSGSVGKFASSTYQQENTQLKRERKLQVLLYEGSGNLWCSQNKALHFSQNLKNLRR